MDCDICGTNVCISPFCNCQDEDWKCPTNEAIKMKCFYIYIHKEDEGRPVKINGTTLCEYCYDKYNNCPIEKFPEKIQKLIMARFL